MDSNSYTLNWALVSSDPYYADSTNAVMPLYTAMDTGVSVMTTSGHAMIDYGEETEDEVVETVVEQPVIKTVSKTHCEYCGSEWYASEYRPGTCRSCGAPRGEPDTVETIQTTKERVVKTRMRPRRVQQAYDTGPTILFGSTG